MSERFTVGELSHLSKSLCKPLCKACPGCGGMVHIRKEVVLVAMCLLQSITSTFRKHTLRRSFRAIETVEKAVDQLTCKQSL